MDLVYLLPIVIPTTVLVPILLLSMIYNTAKKRVAGKSYIKDMTIMSLISSFYVFLYLLFIYKLFLYYCIK